VNIGPKGMMVLAWPGHSTCNRRHHILERSDYGNQFLRIEHQLVVAIHSSAIGCMAEVRFAGYHTKRLRYTVACP